jgi:hypothetical protein
MGSHHGGTSLVWTVQNLFEKSNEGKTILRNQTCFILFRNHSDLPHLNHTSRLLLNDTKKLNRCFEWLEESFPEELRPYLYVNTHPLQSTESAKVFSHIIPCEGNKVPNYIMF